MHAVVVRKAGHDTSAGELIAHCKIVDRRLQVSAQRGFHRRAAAVRRRQGAEDQAARTLLAGPRARGGVMRGDPFSACPHRLDNPMKTTMQKLSGQDALFLHMDRPHAATHVTMIYIYDQSGLAQPLRFRQIVGHLEKRLAVLAHVPPPDRAGAAGARLSVLGRRPGLRHRLSRPPPGAAQARRLAAVPDHGGAPARPPARPHATAVGDVRGRRPGQRWIGCRKAASRSITKVHHAAVDGTAMAELTWALHDVEGAKGKRTPVLARQKNVARLEARAEFRRHPDADRGRQRRGAAQARGTGVARPAASCRSRR